MSEIGYITILSQSLPLRVKLQRECVYNVTSYVQFRISSDISNLFSKLNYTEEICDDLNSQNNTQIAEEVRVSTQQTIT